MLMLRVITMRLVLSLAHMIESIGARVQMDGDRQTWVASYVLASWPLELNGGGRGGGGGETSCFNGSSPPLSLDPALWPRWLYPVSSSHKSAT